MSRRTKLALLLGFELQRDGRIVELPLSAQRLVTSSR
jgi:hypothetical protein